MYPALLVHAQHQRVLRRLQSMRTPDAAHTGIGNTHLMRHPAARPMPGSGGLAPFRPGNHFGDHLGRNTRCPSRSGSIFHQTVGARFEKAAPPKSRQTRRHGQPVGNVLVPNSLGGQLKDAAALRHPHRRSAPPRQLHHCKPCFITQFNRWRYTYVRSPHRMMMTTQHA